jgi:alpha-glucosidase
MKQLKWWQTAVFYQIYPRSFADGNRDGIGDFIGMSEKLDYLKDLGVDALWLSPHFKSPQYDCGYDVSDYMDVAPEYGTLDDFKTFLSGAHQRGLRVILDLVLNHTSHEHPWFIESRSSRHNPKRDWYIWQDGKDGGFPNNWQSCFDGPAWEFDPQTDQYYYHYFLKQQPDLNWRNPEVKQAMWQAVRFWLDMGVDGFRLDAIGTIYEDPAMPDNPVGLSMVDLGRKYFAAQTDEEKQALFNLWEDLFKFQVEQPGMHPLMQELRSIFDEYAGDRVLIGENDLLEYHGNGHNELHMVFNFPLMQTRQITPSWVRRNQKHRLQQLYKISPGAWPCNTLGNHDCARMYNNYGDGKHDAELAQLNLALLLTLRGTPFLYNGEEFGMTDLYLHDINLFRDVPSIWQYNTMVKELGVPEEMALQEASKMSRDKNRTPMQWRNAPNGGFSPAGVTTWLPVNPNYAQGINAEEQRSDPSSLLNFYKTMLRFRKANPALIEGEYLPLKEKARSFLAFLRKGSDQTCLVLLNYSSKPLTLDIQEAGGKLKILFTNQDRGGKSNTLNKLDLLPYEILISEVH